MLQTGHPDEEIQCTDPFPSVSIPCQVYSYRISMRNENSKEFLQKNTTIAVREPVACPIKVL
jgi:hypothetical protein